MKIMLSVCLVLLALSLSGCASNEYREYAEAQTAVAKAHSEAESARWKAMEEIGKSGDTTARVAAMMAMQSQGSSGRQQQHIAPPKSFAEEARNWLGIIVSPLVQGYGIHENTRAQIRQSDNTARLGESTNATFLGIAGRIPATSLPNVTYNASAGSVINGGTANSGDGSSSGQGAAVQNGTGAVGGTYAPVSASNNPVDNSNQGNATAVPTVVTQPAPVIVTQPTPTVVTQPTPTVVQIPAGRICTTSATGVTTCQ